MKCDKSKLYILHHPRISPKQSTGWGFTGHKHPCRKREMVPFDKNNTCQPSCVFAAKHANCTLACVSKNAEKQVQGSFVLFLFDSSEMASGILCPVLASPARVRDWHSGAGPVESYKVLQGTGAHDIEDAERSGLFSFQKRRLRGDLTAPKQEGVEKTEPEVHSRRRTALQAR